MGKNRRRVFEDAGESDRREGIPCADCGCRHSYVVRTERIGETVRRTRECRHCGRTFVTTETK